MHPFTKEETKAYFLTILNLQSIDPSSRENSQIDDFCEKLTTITRGSPLYVRHLLQLTLPQQNLMHYNAKNNNWVINFQEIEKEMGKFLQKVEIFGKKLEGDHGAVNSAETTKKNMELSQNEQQRIVTHELKVSQNSNPKKVSRIIHAKIDSLQQDTIDLLKIGAMCNFDSFFSLEILNMINYMSVEKIWRR